MSTEVVGAAGGLADLDHYGSPRELPPEWLVRLNLGRPRRGIECLDETTRIAKRVLDVVGALALMLVLAPAFLAVAALVYLTSPGPVIFRQLRTGLNQRRP